MHSPTTRPPNRGKARWFYRDKVGLSRLNVARVATKKVKADRCVSMLKALADEHRWDIVRTLLAESLSVSQLGERLDMAQPSVSKHLNILRAAGIVVTERVGKEVRGSIAEAFRAELSRNKNRLDLGCCSFDFNSPRR